jgi:hypothetical protein
LPAALRSLYWLQNKGKVMRRVSRSIAATAGITALLGLGACAVTPPSGPTVMALPAAGKSLSAFQQDDYYCRGFASQQAGYPAPGSSGVGAAAGGTLLGAAAGAAIGALAGNAGAGAAIGAGTGLVGGSAVGANNAQASQYGLQQRYNIAYTQCMYSRGNSVQSPPPGYAFGGYASPGWAYAPGVWGPGFWGPSYVVGFGGGWGGGWGWRGGGWGWHGGGWHH